MIINYSLLRLQVILLNLTLLANTNELSSTNHVYFVQPHVTLVLLSLLSILFLFVFCSVLTTFPLFCWLIPWCLVTNKYLAGLFTWCPLLITIIVLLVPLVLQSNSTKFILLHLKRTPTGMLMKPGISWLPCPFTDAHLHMLHTSCISFPSCHSSRNTDSWVRSSSQKNVPHK